MAVATETPTSQPPAGGKRIAELLETLTTCLTSTGASLPHATRDDSSASAIEPPADGISLLDTKNELLLSYLHNLVFLIIFQLRQLPSSKNDSANGDAEKTRDSLRQSAVTKLVELRVFLDRGVRPLEARLKYQLDKVIKAAEDAERAQRSAPQTKGKTRRNSAGSDEEEGSSSDDSDGDEDEDDEEGEEEDIDEMAYRPNISAFSKSVEPPAKKADKFTKDADTSDGIYRPPKIMPTSLPSTERRERNQRRLAKSSVIDEFVADEMSAAPMAQPSIGSTIVRGGREMKTQKEREYEAERRRYEETNFVRLPKESKKDRAKRGQRGPQGTFGGEDWRGLGEGADRIARLTQRTKGSGGALEKSRKRRLTEDRPRSDGTDVGQLFEKRRKKIEGWKRS